MNICTTDCRFTDLDQHFLGTRFWHRYPFHPKAFLGTGLLGSFTTFSALAVDVVALGDRAGLLAVYALVSMAGGLALARMGVARGAARAVTR